MSSLHHGCCFKSFIILNIPITMVEFHYMPLLILKLIKKQNMVRFLFSFIWTLGLTSKRHTCNFYFGRHTSHCSASTAIRMLEILHSKNLQDMRHIGATLSFHDSLTYRRKEEDRNTSLGCQFILNLCLLWTIIATSKVVGES